MMYRRNPNLTPPTPATPQDRVYFDYGCAYVITTQSGQSFYAKSQEGAYKAAQDKQGAALQLRQTAQGLQRYVMPPMGSYTPPQWVLSDSDNAERRLNDLIAPRQSLRVANWQARAKEFETLFKLRKLDGCMTGSEDDEEGWVPDKPLIQGIRPSAKDAFFVSYGLGVDSTALLVALVREYRAGNKRARPDAITFADVGGEVPDTYGYLPIINEYLRNNDFPEVTVVKYSGTEDYNTLEASCLALAMYPSVVYGENNRSCSDKWKHSPQEKLRRGLAVTQKAWASGNKAIVAIGYDAGKKDAKRKSYVVDPGTKTELFHYWYPLREYNWNREQCKLEIAAERLPVPRKSACYFCPSTQTYELDQTIILYPDLADRIIEIERVADPWQDRLAGLWNFKAKQAPHYGSMTAYINLRREQLAAGDTSWVPTGMRTLARPGEDSLPRPVYKAFNAERGGPRLKQRIEGYAEKAVEKAYDTVLKPRSRVAVEQAQAEQEWFKLAIRSAELGKPIKSLTDTERKQALARVVDPAQTLVVLAAKRALDKRQEAQDKPGSRKAQEAADEALTALRYTIAAAEAGKPLEELTQAEQGTADRRRNVKPEQIIENAQAAARLAATLVHEAKLRTK